MSPRSKQKASHEASASPFTKPVDRLRWIVEFAYDQSEPTETLTRRNLVQALGKYLFGILLKNPDEDDGDLGIATCWDPEQSLDLPMRGEDSCKWWEDKLALVRSSARKVLKDYLEPPQFGAHHLPAELTLQRVLGKQQLKDTLIAQDIREGVIFCLLKDLASAGKDLQKCPAENCPRLFVRQYRQNFCSASCRHRTNYKAWYHRKKKEGTVVTPGQDKGEQMPATAPKKKSARSQKEKKKSRPEGSS
jgi:hypothetical protein